MNRLFEGTKLDHYFIHSICNKKIIDIIASVVFSRISSSFKSFLLFATDI